jgi:CDP-glycerol glycerophosphotransferase (TagB/SpsB family)
VCADNRTIALLGSGKEGQKIAEFLKKQDENNLFFIDNNSDLWNSHINNVKIYSIEKLKDMRPSRIVICHNAYFSAIRQLCSYGFYRFEIGLFKDSEVVSLKTIDLEGKNIEIQNNKIVILSTANMDSNSRALYNNVPKEIKEKFNIVFLTYGSLSNKQFLSESLIYEFLTGKYFIGETHESAFLMWQKLDCQTYIETWHGMPIKSTVDFDYLKKHINQKGIPPVFNMDYCISCSSLYTYQMSLSFGLNPCKFAITGYPRNDYMFGNNKTDIFSRLNFSNFQNKKILYYMPTYRANVERKSDGEYSFSFRKENSIWSSLFGFEGLSIENFTKFLDENNILLLLKIHPAEEARVMSEIGELNSKSIILITTRMLKESNMENYRLLGISDALITDYSSVYFDYLLLDKPIIFTINDKETYSRGFMFNPPEPWMPGEKPENQQQLETAVTNALYGEDVFKAERTQLKNMSHKYQDGQSTIRVWEWIDKLLSDAKKEGL